MPALRCSCRKRLVSRREAEGLATELWSPRFVTMQRLCSQLFYVTAANQRTRVEIELLPTVEVGLPAFQLPMFAKWDALPKKESIPAAITFWISKHPLLTRSFRLLRAAAGSTSSALCLHYACTRSHAFVEDSGFALHAEKQNRSGHGVVVSKVFLPFAMSTIKMCRDCSHSGLEVGLPAF